MLKPNEKGYLLTDEEIDQILNFWRYLRDSSEETVRELFNDLAHKTMTLAYLLSDHPYDDNEGKIIALTLDKVPAFRSVPLWIRKLRCLTRVFEESKGGPLLSTKEFLRIAYEHSSEEKFVNLKPLAIALINS